MFCEVTESVAHEFRRRVAGRGIRIFCFVDDYLLVGGCLVALLVVTVWRCCTATTVPRLAWHPEGWEAMCHVSV